MLKAQSQEKPDGNFTVVWNIASKLPGSTKICDEYHSLISKSKESANTKSLAVSGVSENIHYVAMSTKGR